MATDAVRRFEAIEAASDLGAGFNWRHTTSRFVVLNFLGEDQSGNMQTIGFSLYMEMLDEAVYVSVRKNTGF